MAPEPPSNGNSRRTSFPCRRTVSAKKIEANRSNASRSTGPRTERGKSNSRFNAVTLGLFADQVAIPACDGEKAEKDFSSLLSRLHEEFRPVGVYEEWLVVKIAESMWRLRRARRCESGSVRKVAFWDKQRDHDKVIKGLASDLDLLEDSEKQLRDSGTLARETYAKVLPFVEEQKRLNEGKKPVSAEIDRALFLTCISDRKRVLECVHRSLVWVEGERAEAVFDQEALPPVETMDKVLRYEERMYRQMDWAMQRLRESQERRFVRFPSELPLIPNSSKG